MITCSGTIGKVALVGKHWEEWTASQHIIRVVPADKDVAGYISVFLASDYGYPLITHYTYGSVVDEIDDRRTAQDSMCSAEKYPIEYETDNLKRELKRYNVDVRLNTEVTLDLIRELAPDAVIAATGSVPAVPPIKGVENAVQSWDILDGSSKLPEEENVVMIGGGIVACETAHMIAKEGRSKVTILEMLPAIANGLEATHLGDLMTEFAELKVEAITNARVLEIRPGEVEYAIGNETQTIKCDTSVLATGQRAEGRDLIDEIKADGFRVIIAGDAIRPRKIMDAVREGNFAAYQL